MNRSSHDMLALTAEANKRMVGTLSRWAARSGSLLTLTPMQESLLVNARHLHRRFDAGDYRHSDNEQGLLLELCGWLASIHARLAGSADKTIEIDTRDLSVESDDKMPPAGAYRRVTIMSLAGWPGNG